MVSIIVPIYNAEKYLRRCVDSILVQTFTDFELLLINDGSIDKSGEICDEYALIDSRVHTYHKENGGVSSARNLGLKKAKGNYICFVDSDDFVDSNYIETLLPVNGEEMVVCSICYEGGRSEEPLIKSKMDMVSIKNNLHWMSEHMAFCGPCCKIFSRDIIEKNKIRFDTNISAGEDMLFVWDYISIGLKCIRTISTPMYHYNIADSGSLSHKIVNFTTTEYVLDCIKSRMERLSKVYNWDSNYGYKRHCFTQLNNFLVYIRNVRSLIGRIRLLLRVFKNKHIQNLLSDTEFIIKYKNIYGFKAIALRCLLFPFKFHYFLR